MINYTSDRKFMIIYLIYKMTYFPEPYTCSRNKIKVKLHFSTYVTKSHLKTQQVDLANIKSDIDELNIGKLKTLPVDS